MLAYVCDAALTIHSFVCRISLRPHVKTHKCTEVGDLFGLRFGHKEAEREGEGEKEAGIESNQEQELVHPHLPLEPPMTRKMHMIE